MTEETQTELPDHVRYAGFYVRSFAAMIDTLVIAMPLSVVLTLILPQMNVAEFQQQISVMQPQSEAEAMMMMREYLLQGELLRTWAMNNLISALLFGAIVIALWMKYGATPGKMVFGIQIVDATTGELPSRRQDILRYIGYFVAALPLTLGLLWVLWDKKKRGWHDYMAGTAVIYTKSLEAPPVVEEPEEAN